MSAQKKPDETRQPNTGERQESQKASPVDEVGIRKYRNLRIVGAHPLEVDSDGKPLNTSPTLFPDMLVTGRPNHGHALAKKCLIDLYAQGRGVDVEMPATEKRPAVAVSSGQTKLNPEEVEALSGIVFSKDAGDETFKITKDRLTKSVEEKFMENIHAYVPLVIRGAGENVELVVRKDAHIVMDRVNDSIEALEKGYGIPPLKVKVIGSGMAVNKELFREFEKRGELWRLYPPMKSKKQQKEFILDSTKKTDHGVKLYYCPGTGEGLLPYGELADFVSIYRSCPDSERGRAGGLLAKRLREIIRLNSEKNRENRRSLVFFGLKKDSEYNPIEDLEKAARLIEDGAPEADVDGQLKALKKNLKDATEKNLRKDDLDDKAFRRTVYERLMGYSPENRGVEAEIGLGSEYKGEVAWEPGGITRHAGSQWHVEISRYAPQRAAALIKDLEKHCHEQGQELEHVNVGKVIESMSKRKKLGEDEHREVYVVEWKTSKPPAKHVDLIRRQKWDEQHYLDGMEFPIEGSDRMMFLGLPTVRAMRADHHMNWYLTDERGDRQYIKDAEGRRAYGEGRRLSKEQAKSLSREYRSYFLARLDMEEKLGIERPDTNAISFMQDHPSHGEIEVVLFDRKFVEGRAVDKMAPEFFRNMDFNLSLTRFMGKEAAINFALGRRNPFTGEVVYADGDEIAQLSKEGENMKVDNIIMADSTSMMGDVDSDHKAFTPAYANWLARVFRTARKMGVDDDGISRIGKTFFKGFRDEYERLQKVVSERGEEILESLELPETTIGQEKYGWDTIDIRFRKARSRMLSEENSADRIIDSIKKEKKLRRYEDVLS